MGSPPKPWERNAGIAAASNPAPAASLPPATPSSTSAPTATAVATHSSPSSYSSTPPQVPDRPAALSSALSYGYGTSPYSRLGTTYGGYGGLGSLGGYNTLGSYGGMGYGGLGGMGYGGYGMGYGMGGYGGMGYPGGMPPLDPNNPSLTQSISSTTEQTFALLHSMVQTFTGVAQMLESTFMATHSSFFAMVGVVEQLGHLRNMLASVLGLFGLARWLKDLLTGNRTPPGGGAMQHEFRQFLDGKPVQGPPGPPARRLSKKPLIIFFLAIVGIPYAMNKLVRALNEKATKEREALGIAAPLDPSKLSFARALYPFNASTPSELSLKQDEIVAIVGKLDPRTGTEVDPRLEVEGGEWWKGRTREGREGWFPKKWVQIIERPAPKLKEVD